VLVILFSLFLSVGALAQNTDTTRKDTSKAPLVHAKKTYPLVIMDGLPYKGDIKSIDPNTIMDITVLKGNHATSAYGPEASAGAIVIRTKKYANGSLPLKLGGVDSIADKNAVFVVDGQLSDHKLDGITPDSIVSIDILKPGKGSVSNELMHTTVVVITRAYAIQKYQKKFSAFSKEYVKTIVWHNHNDENFQYEIDGVIVKGDRNAIIEKLYKIPAEKIKKVTGNRLVLMGDHDLIPRKNKTKKK